MSTPFWTPPTERLGQPVRPPTVRISDRCTWASEPVVVVSGEDLAAACRQAFEDWCTVCRLEDEANQAVRPSRHHPNPGNLAFARRYAHRPGPLDLQVLGKYHWLMPWTTDALRYGARACVLTDGPRWINRPVTAWEQLLRACQLAECHDRAIGTLSGWIGGWPPLGADGQ